MRSEEAAREQAGAPRSPPNTLPSQRRPASRCSGSGDTGLVNAQQNIVRRNSRTSGGLIRRALPGLSPMIRVEPGDPVVGKLVTSALIKVQQGENHGRQRG